MLFMPIIKVGFNHVKAVAAYPVETKRSFCWTVPPRGNATCPTKAFFIGEK